MHLVHVLTPRVYGTHTCDSHGAMGTTVTVTGTVLSYAVKLDVGAHVKSKGTES